MYRPPQLTRQKRRLIWLASGNSRFVKISVVCQAKDALEAFQKYKSQGLSVQGSIRLIASSRKTRLPEWPESSPRSPTLAKDIKAFGH